MAFWNWLRKYTSFSSYLLFLTPLVWGTILLAGISTRFARRFFSEQSLSANGEGVNRLFAHMSVGKVLMLASVYVPLCEEFLFRFLPFCLIYFVLRYCLPSKDALEMKLVAFGAVLTSLVFGYLHGVGNILIQGIVGLVFVIVFLKMSCRASSFLNLVRGWMASAIFHGSYNGLLFLLARAIALNK